MTNDPEEIKDENGGNNDRGRRPNANNVPSPNRGNLPITPGRSARLNPSSNAEIQFQQLKDRIDRVEINDTMKNSEMQAIKNENDITR